MMGRVSLLRGWLSSAKVFLMLLLQHTMKQQNGRVNQPFKALRQLCIPPAATLTSMCVGMLLKVKDKVVPVLSLAVGLGLVPWYLGRKWPTVPAPDDE
jgi:hypothetical protein